MMAIEKVIYVGIDGQTDMARFDQHLRYDAEE